MDAAIKLYLTEILSNILDESRHTSIGIELSAIIIDFWIGDEFDKNIFVNKSIPQHTNYNDDNTFADALKSLLHSSQRYIELFLQIQFHLITSATSKLADQQIQNDREIESAASGLDFDETHMNMLIIANSEDCTLWISK